MASERIRLYGNQLVIGDLVDAARSSDNTEVTEESEVQHQEGSSKSTTIKIIESEEDLANFTMDDLILPLPGHEVKYPTNKVFDSYKSFMGQHGFDPLDMKRSQRDFSLPGSYRKVLGMAKDLDWQFLRYDDPTVSLSMTDLDQARGLPAPVSIPGKYFESAFSYEKMQNLWRWS